MRLFLAIPLEESVRKMLYQIENEFFSYTEKGNFTLYENLHLTLVFLGETDRLAEVKQAMDSVKAKKFLLHTAKLGSFKKAGGDLYWIGILPSQELSSLHAQLCKQLWEKNFLIENRKYSPHLTLARQVILKKDFQIEKFQERIPELFIQVEKISLMKSERIKGKLTYTSIYEKFL